MAMRKFRRMRRGRRPAFVESGSVERASFQGLLDDEFVGGREQGRDGFEALGKFKSIETASGGVDGRSAGCERWSALSDGEALGIMPSRYCLIMVSVRLARLPRPLASRSYNADEGVVTEAAILPEDYFAEQEVAKRLDPITWRIGLARTMLPRDLLILSFSKSSQPCANIFWPAFLMATNCPPKPSSRTAGCSSRTTK